jgi:hypothetical protein
MASIIANWCFSKVTTEKEEAQQTRMPPEAPKERQKSNLSNFLGAKFLIYRRSKFSLLVSWRQRILAQLYSNLFLTASHLFGSLIPRIFQHKIFQDLLSN